MTTMNALIIEHYAAMRSLARRLTWGTDLADDVVQSACVLALSSTIDPNTIEEPRSWLNHQVRNAYYTAMKKIIGPAKRTRNAGLLAGREIAVDGAQEVTTDLGEALMRVANLPPRQRDLLMMHAIGWTMAELGDMHGVHKQAISQTLQRARARLAA